LLGEYSAMEPVPEPAEIVFDLNAAECASVRKEIGGVNRWMVAAWSLNALCGISQGVLRFMAHGPRDPLGIGFIVIYMVMFGLLALSTWWRTRAIAPQTNVVVRFEPDGVRVTNWRHRAPADSSVSFAEIGSVRQLPEAIVILPRSSPAIVIPRRMLSNHGADLMRFFRDRLVGKRMLSWPSSSTTIVNTATS